jgi:hypothetical protein
VGEENSEKIPDLVADIKRTRLEWLGHVTRMDQIRVVKKSLNVWHKGKEKKEDQD